MQKGEGKFKTALKKEIENRLPGSMVFYLNPNDIKGIPDLEVLYESRWAVLEAKKSEEDYKKDLANPEKMSQSYYVNKMNNMSFAAFIFPENKEEVLNAMERALRSPR
jgi:predicted RNA-binding protein with EMAP domain